MNIEEVRNYCIEKPHITEHFPFDDTTLVIKVMDKMFALISLEGDNTINLKCNPEYAIELREHFDFIVPGYHMSKKHWNTIHFKICPDKLLKEMIDESYNLIVQNLPKTKQSLM